MNIYDRAIHVQDACNPSGVALFLVECVKHIRDVEGVTDTAKICGHPLFILVVNKLDSLAGYSDQGFPGAYAACKYRSMEHEHHDPHDRMVSDKMPGHESWKPQYCWGLENHDGDCEFTHSTVGLEWHCNKTR